MMKILKKMYYDSFKDEYTLDVEDTAPPERYLPTYRGDGIYIEEWRVKTDSDLQSQSPHFLTIAYSQMDVEMRMVNRIRHAQEKQNKCTLQRLYEWIIPSTKFDEYAIKFGLIGGTSE